MPSRIQKASVTKEDWGLLTGELSTFLKIIAFCGLIVSAIIGVIWLFAEASADTALKVGFLVGGSFLLAALAAFLFYQLDVTIALLNKDHPSVYKEIVSGQVSELLYTVTTTFSPSGVSSGVPLYEKDTWCRIGSSLHWIDKHEVIDKGSATYLSAQVRTEYLVYKNRRIRQLRFTNKR